MKTTERINYLSEKLHENVLNSNDYLTPLERFNCVNVHNAKPDRLMTWAFYREYPRYLENLTVKDIETDYLKECENMLAGLVEFGYDTIWTNVDPYSVTPEALGCQIDMQEDEISVPMVGVINKPEDLKNLKNIDPTKDGRLPVVLNTVSLLREKIGDIYPVIGHCSGPVSLASSLRGATKFVIDIKKRPEFVAELLDYCADQTILIGKALLDRGAIGVSMADATGSPSVCSSQQYSELFMPAYRKIQKALGHLTPPGVRWHSQSGIDELADIKSFVEESCEAGNTVFHVATPWALNCDIRAILEILKSYGACLWFGMAPAIFASMTPDEMDATVKEYIGKYAKGYEGNFLMGPNMLNDTSKPELVKAWMNAMKKYGTC
ncbi:MAG: hypothetical protein HGA49_00415 [Eubacteriaceae bacterium]|nr:hypothetical protein [Eubacteriaceae bacterium]